jgi:integrase
VQGESRGRNVPTLRALGDAFIDRHAQPKKLSWVEDMRKFRRDVYPALGDVRADLITTRDIVGLLDSIHDRNAPIQANRTLALVRKLFNWAIGEGYPVDANPAAGIRVRTKEIARMRVLTEEELRDFWCALDGPGFDKTTAEALRLQLLVGARSHEVTGMTRNELVLDETPPLWVLPRSRATGRREVSRPLPPLALAVIWRRLEAAGASPFIFASPTESSRPLVPEAPRRAIQRAAQRQLIPSGFTPNDLRRTCQTFWRKRDVGEDVVTRILGLTPRLTGVHVGSSTSPHALDEMLSALVGWEAHLLSIVGAGQHIRHHRHADN